MEIKQVEKEYKVKFNANPRMKLSAWLKKKGFKSLSKALNLAEKEKVCIR